MPSISNNRCGSQVCPSEISARAMAYHDEEACMADERLTTRSVAPPWGVHVLDCWLGELGDDTFWFGASGELDERIRRRFLPIHEQIINSGGWGLAGARPLLAGIVVLDQFSRNMFRGTPRTFAADPVARR